MSLIGWTMLLLTVVVAILYMKNRPNMNEGEVTVCSFILLGVTMVTFWIGLVMMLIRPELKWASIIIGPIMIYCITTAVVMKQGQEIVKRRRPRPSSGATVDG